MADIPYPRSFAGAQVALLRELEDECQAVQDAGTMDVMHLREAVQAFARQVKEEGGSVERALALLRACLKTSGLDATGQALRYHLSEQTFEWAMEVYYGPAR